MCSSLWAEPIALHNKEYKELAAKILAYEKRVDILIKQKEDTKEGPDLENILTEISDLQKGLVGIKKRRRELREHVTKNHPKEEILDDLSILKDAESSRSKKGSDPAMDARLDDMLKKLRAQYNRSASEDDEDYTVEQQAVEDELNRKKKNVQKENKDQYIRENIKTKLKVN